MFLDELGRHLAVSSMPELEPLLQRDQRFWSVVSIREPQVRRPECLRYAKRFHEVICEDREEVDPAVPSRPPRMEDVVGLLKFVDAHPGEPLLVHCLAGLSRSPAVALALIVRGLLEKGGDATKGEDLAERAVDLLLQIRPRARPNVLFLKLCLEQCLPADQAHALTGQLANHPILRANRFRRPSE